VPRVSARHALIYCLLGALKVAMIRGLAMVRRDWIMLAPSGTQASPAARAGTYYGDVVDSGFGALEPGGAGLILGMRFARRRGFAA